MARHEYKGWYRRPEEPEKLYWYCDTCANDYGNTVQVALNIEIWPELFERPCDRCKDDYNTAMVIEHGMPWNW